MKAAIYLRVSGARQDEENQEPECVRICAARGWEPVIFRDVETGSKRVAARAGLSACLEAARLGQVGAVVVWALDRLGRDRFDVGVTLRRLFGWGAGVVSARESWVDQAGPFRDLMVEIVAWFAEQERARIIERTRAGLDAARARGVRLGRPPVVVPPDVVEKAATWRRRGFAWRYLAAAAGVDPQVIRRAVLKRYPDLR